MSFKKAKHVVLKIHLEYSLFIVKVWTELTFVYFHISFDENKGVAVLLISLLNISHDLGKYLASPVIPRPRAILLSTEKQGR